MGNSATRQATFTFTNTTSPTLHTHTHLTDHLVVIGLCVIQECEGVVARSPRVGPYQETTVSLPLPLEELHCFLWREREHYKTKIKQNPSPKHSTF